MTTPLKSQAPASGGVSNKNAPPPMPYPFPVGVYESTTQDYDNTVQLGSSVTAWTSPVQAPLWNLSPTGWLRGIFFDFTLFFGSGNAAGAFANDGPWSLIQKVILYDLGGEVVISLLGYEWLMMNKFGGYFNVGDPRGDITYVTNPTAGNSQASPAAHFIMYLPLEVVLRDALGVVQNESKPGWKIELWFDTAANAVAGGKTSGGTPFTGAATVPSVRVKGYLDSYTEPAAAAPNGRPFAQTPPLPGSLQYWKQENTALPTGSAKFDLSNGIGFPLRNILYYTRDAADVSRSTSDANWPDPATLLIGNINYFTKGRNLWISKVGKSYGFTGYGGAPAAADTSMGRENGVWPVFMTQDLANDPGQELRFKYIDTQVNTLIRLTGVFGGALTFFAVTNWVATPSQNRYALIAGG
jgi:hypothetical protein